MTNQRALPSGLPLLAGGAASAARTSGLCPLDSRSSPEGPPLRRAPAGSALWTPAPRRRDRLCGAHQRALPSGLPLLAGGAASAARTSGLCPLDSRSSPEGPPLRRAPAGSALWTPAGALPQTPRCFASPPRLRAGRGIGCSIIVPTVLPSLPKGLQAGRSFSLLTL